MTTHNSWRGTCVGSASLLLSISHSIETLASVGEETKEESRLQFFRPCLFDFSKFLFDLPLKMKFSSIFHCSTGRLVLSIGRSNLTRQSILGSFATRKLAIRPYYVEFLLMCQTLNYGSVWFNLIPQ